MSKISAAAGIGGGILNTAAGIYQHKSNQWENRRENQKNRDFTERMSSTAYQRQAKDLEKAGLNKYLAYGGSSAGASTPSGSAARGGSGGSIGGFSNSANAFQQLTPNAKISPTGLKNLNSAMALSK